jgi:hypothetical protein
MLYMQVEAFVKEGGIVDVTRPLATRNPVNDYRDISTVGYAESELEPYDYRT